MKVSGEVTWVQDGETRRGKREIRLRVRDESAGDVRLKWYPRDEVQVPSVADVIDAEIVAVAPWTNGRSCDLVIRTVSIRGHREFIPVHSDGVSVQVGSRS